MYMMKEDFSSLIIYMNERPFLMKPYILYSDTECVVYKHFNEYTEVNKDEERSFYRISEVCISPKYYLFKDVALMYNSKGQAKYTSHETAKQATVSVSKTGNLNLHGESYAYSESGYAHKSIFCESYSDEVNNRHVVHAFKVAKGVLK